MYLAKKRNWPSLTRGEADNPLSLALSHRFLGMTPFRFMFFFSTLKFLDKNVVGKAQVFRALWSISQVEFSLLAIVTGGVCGEKEVEGSPKY
jgi:hypothetical protein